VQDCTRFPNEQLAFDPQIASQLSQSLFKIKELPQTQSQN